MSWDVYMDGKHIGKAELHLPMPTLLDPGPLKCGICGRGIVFKEFWEGGRRAGQRMECEKHEEEWKE